jgi:glyoxylase-like metal-dependent hydrolase (beta-lactamase superfamily II)
VKSIETLDVLTLAERAKQRGLYVEASKVDVQLKDEDVLNVGKHKLKIIHTPGHTPGSICIFLEEWGKRILFSGDIVSAQGRLGFINGPGFNLDDWKKTLKHLVDLRIDAMFPGHGTFVLSDACDHIKLYSDKMNAPWINIVTELG